MFKTISDTIQFVVDKTEFIDKLYSKYIPKTIRFILIPFTQFLLILTLAIALSISLPLSFFLFIGGKIKEEYQNYE
jgi:ABC-type transport system involved in cytochrome bd biosynthesis fused ATPase/permease subunit